MHVAHHCSHLIKFSSTKRAGDRDPTTAVGECHPIPFRKHVGEFSPTKEARGAQAIFVHHRYPCEAAACRPLLVGVEGATISVPHTIDCGSSPRYASAIPLYRPLVCYVDHRLAVGEFYPGQGEVRSRETFIAGREIVVCEILARHYDGSNSVTRQSECCVLSLYLALTESLHRF